MKKGDVMNAPRYLRGHARLRWKVEVLSRVKDGNVLVRWLEGILRGREARLQARTLEKVA